MTYISRVLLENQPVVSMEHECLTLARTSENSWAFFLSLARVFLDFLPIACFLGWKESLRYFEYF